MTKKQIRQVPQYRRQKRPYQDSAFVEIHGKRIYLGPYGSKESVLRYKQVLAESEAGILPQAVKAKATPLLIAQLCDIYMNFARSYRHRKCLHHG